MCSSVAFFVLNLIATVLSIILRLTEEPEFKESAIRVSVTIYLALLGHRVRKASSAALYMKG